MNAPARISHYPRRDGKLPAGAKYVGRPSRWGNPYSVEDHGLERAVELYRWHAIQALAADRAWLDPLRDATALACACPLNLDCHADVLRELIAATATARENAA